MASDIIASRQGNFIGADEDVEVTITGAQIKAVLLQNIDSNEIYLKVLMDKGAFAMNMVNGGGPQIAYADDMIAIEGDKFIINSSVAAADDLFTWLAII